MEAPVAPASAPPANWPADRQQQQHHHHHHQGTHAEESRFAGGGGDSNSLLPAAHARRDAEPNPYSHLNPYSLLSIAAVLALHTDAMRAVSVLGFAEYTVGMLAELAEEKKRLEEQLAAERERGRRLACAARAILGLDPEPLQRLAALRECLDSLGSFGATDRSADDPAPAPAPSPAGSVDPAASDAAPAAGPGPTSGADQELDDIWPSGNDRTQVREPDTAPAAASDERTEVTPPPPDSKPFAEGQTETGGVEAAEFDDSFDSTTVDIEVPVRDVEEDESYESSVGSRRLRCTPQRARKKMKRSSAQSWQVGRASSVDWQSPPVGRSASVPRIPQPAYSSTPIASTPGGAEFGEALVSRSSQQPARAAAGPKPAPASALSSSSARRSSRHSVTFEDSPMQEAIQKPKASCAIKDTPAPAASSDESSPRRAVLSALSLASAKEAPRSRAASHPPPGTSSIDYENVPQTGALLLHGPPPRANSAPKPAAAPAPATGPAPQRRAVPPVLVMPASPGRLTMPAPFATILVSREHFDAFWRLKYPAPSRPRPIVADCDGLSWDAKNPFPFPTLHLGPCGTLIALVGMTRTYGYAYFILTYLVTGSDDGSPHFTLVPCFSKGDVYISAGEVTGLTAEVEEELRAAKKRPCLSYGDISISHARALLKYLENLP